MKVYAFGRGDAPAIMLLPGTCCHWKGNFGHVIPLLERDLRVLCVSYDGFDETEDTEFPGMLEETEKIETYIKENCGGHIRAAYGCSLGGSFMGLLAARLMDRIDYDFSALGKKSSGLMHRFGFLEVAMRQNDLACEVRDYLRTHPNAAVVNLGCGLDDTGRSCDNGSCKIYNLDLPDVISVRNELLPAGEREKNIPCDLNDTSWFGEIDASGGAVFFAAGVFYYFLKEQVSALVRKMADAFPGGVLVFDAANEKAVKLMLKTWIKDADIKDVGAYFAVSDAVNEISSWDSRLRVTSRGYMLGYNDLRDPAVSGFFRFLSKVGDRMMKMQIIRIGFGA